MTYSGCVGCPSVEYKMKCVIRELWPRVLGGTAFTFRSGMPGVAVSSIFSTSANAFCIHFTASTALFASVIPDASRSDVREVDFIMPLPISRILAAKCSRLGSLSMERANVNFIERLMTVRRLTSGDVMRLSRLSSLSVCKKPSNSVNNSPKQGYHVPRERTCDFLKHELCDRVVATSPCLKRKSLSTDLTMKTRKTTEKLKRG